MGESVTGADDPRAPFIVGLGGALREASSTERLLASALEACERLGARTQLIGGASLDLPAYAPDRRSHLPLAAAMVEALRRADGVIVATPAYHAAPSGLIKNALDYVEDMRGDVRPYLDGRAVGCIVATGGWQAGAATLGTLRQIVHALRGWPTPLGLVVNTSGQDLALDGEAEPGADLRGRLDLMAQQVVGFARAFGTADR